MMLRLLSLQEQRAPKKQRTINATHCAYGTRRSSSNRPPSTKTLVTNDGLLSLAQLDTLLETRPQQQTMMRREHPTEVAAKNLCMRMQPTAHTLLCTAKHDCTMNSLRTGQSRDEGEAAGLAEDTFTITPVLSKTRQALGPNQVAVVEQARHKHNT